MSAIPPPVPASDLIRIGQSLEALRALRETGVDAFHSAAGVLLGELDRAKFVSSRAAAAVLTNPITSENGFIPSQTWGQLASVLSAVEAALLAEAGQRRLLAVQDHLVSDKLRGLPAAVTLTATQTHLLGETIRCLESGAYRSAAVMGWNLCYEYIRWWMWDDTARRSNFNTKLMSLTDRRGTVLYPTGIAAYEDFYSIKPTLGERDVLDNMKDIGLLTGVYETLAGRLRERNSYAHANGLIPSVYQANYYIENLVDLIRSPPFV